MRFAFLGAVEGSRIGLESLLAAGLAPALVVALPESAARRHSDYAPVGSVARTAGLPVVETRDINAPEVLDAVRRQAIDVSFVIGWSQVCGPAFLAATPRGAVGYHPAALPRLRGLDVIPWTILIGEWTTASTLFWLDQGVDSGPIIAQLPFAVDPDETATTLYRKHNRALADMLPDAVRRLAEGDVAGTAQDEGLATWCARRTPDDGLVDWSRPGREVERLIRAVAEPYPCAFTFDGDARITIRAARLWPDAARHLGLPGQVLAVGGGGFAVRCGDGDGVEVTAWSGAAAPPKLHARLNGGAHR